MNPGDIVVLKSGGPRMTVTSVRAGEGISYAFCKWFDDLGQLHTEKFNLAALRLELDDQAKD